MFVVIWAVVVLVGAFLCLVTRPRLYHVKPGSITPVGFRLRTRVSIGAVILSWVGSILFWGGLVMLTISVIKEI